MKFKEGFDENILLFSPEPIQLTVNLNEKASFIEGSGAIDGVSIYTGKVFLKKIEREL